MREDLRAFEKAVNKVLECSVTQNQFDALVSFAYNLGAGALRNSTLLKRLHAGDVKGAADEFPKWNKAAGKVPEGLTRRRMMERQYFYPDRGQKDGHSCGRREMTMKVYKGMKRKGRGEILCPFNVLRAVFSLSLFHHPPPLSARAWPGCPRK